MARCADRTPDPEIRRRLNMRPEHKYQTHIMKNLYTNTDHRRVCSGRAHTRWSIFSEVPIATKPADVTAAATGVIMIPPTPRPSAAQPCALQP